MGTLRFPNKAPEAYSIRVIIHAGFTSTEICCHFSFFLRNVVSKGKACSCIFLPNWCSGMVTGHWVSGLCKSAFNHCVGERGVWNVKNTSGTNQLAKRRSRRPRQGEHVSFFSLAGVIDLGRKGRPYYYIHIWRWMISSE